MGTKVRSLDTTLAAILAHPLRCRILTILDTRVASPKQMSDELGVPVGNVSYHARCLAELGAIEMVETRPRRGATEHFYRAISRPVVKKEEIADLSVEQRQSIARLAFQLLTADAGTSLGANVLGKRPEHSMVRLPGHVDQLGWAELAEIFTDAYERILDVMAVSVERLGQAKEPTSIPVVAGLTFFEMP